MHEVRLPKLNSVDDDYVVLEWLVEEGSHVDAGQPLLEVETSKATAEIEAEHPGRLVRVAVPGRREPLGALVALLLADDEEPESYDGARESAADVASPARPDPEPAESRVVVTEKARTLAADLGVDVAALLRLPTRVVREADVRALVASAGTVHRADDGVARGPAETARALALPRGQVAVAATVMAAHTAPTAFLAIEVRVDAALDVCRSERRRLRRMVGLTELVVTGLGRLRSAHPAAFADVADGRPPTVRDGAAVGVTIDVGTGLSVPVVRDADRLDLAAVADRLDELRAAATRGRIDENDLVGSQIMLSLTTEQGTLVSRPLVYPGHACAVSLAAVRTVAVPGPDGGLLWQRVITLGLSYDHRVINGSGAGAALADLRALLENPATLVGDDLASRP